LLTIFRKNSNTNFASRTTLISKIYEPSAEFMAKIYIRARGQEQIYASGAPNDSSFFARTPERNIH